MVQLSFVESNSSLISPVWPHASSRIQALIVSCFSKECLGRDQSSSWTFNSRLPSDAAGKKQI